MSITEPVVVVVVPGAHLMAAVVGERDALLRRVEAAFPGALIAVRGNEVRITGAEADVAGRVFEELADVVQRGEVLDADVVGRVIAMVRNDVAAHEVLTTDIVRVGQGRRLRRHSRPGRRPGQGFRAPRRPR